MKDSNGVGRDFCNSYEMITGPQRRPVISVYGVSIWETLPAGLDLTTLLKRNVVIAPYVPWRNLGSIEQLVKMLSKYLRNRAAIPVATMKIDVLVT